VVPDPEAVESSGLGRRREAGDPVDAVGEERARDAHPHLDHITRAIHEQRAC
jgi:hypothetical protein